MKIRHTSDYIANMIILCKLKFERAMDRFDIDQANIACAQMDWWKSVQSDQLQELSK